MIRGSVSNHFTKTPTDSSSIVRSFIENPDSRGNVAYCASLMIADGVRRRGQTASSSSFGPKNGRLNDSKKNSVVVGDESSVL